MEIDLLSIWRVFLLAYFYYACYVYLYNMDFMERIESLGNKDRASYFAAKKALNKGSLTVVPSIGLGGIDWASSFFSLIAKGNTSASGPYTAKCTLNSHFLDLCK